MCHPSIRMVAVLSIVLSAAACSSGTSSSAPTVAATTTTAAPTTTLAATTTTSAPQPQTATKGDAFCVALISAMQSENTVDLDNGTPESLKATTAATIEAVTVAQAVVPKDFELTMSAFATFLDSVQKALAANNYDRVAFAASDAGKAVLTDPAVGAAFNEIDAYLAAHCA